METETKSEQARRASLARKVHRGGRPKRDDLPERSLKCYGRDAAVLAAYARLRGSTVKGVLNLLCNALINGGTIPGRLELAPPGWRFIR